MRPLGILVTGQPVPNVRNARGSFDRMIRETLGGAWDGPVVVLDAEKGERPRAEELAALVVTGSPASVTTRDPWILDTEDALRAFVSAGAPTLGICFGHQLLAQALGGSVVKNPNGREIGTVELELLEDDALFHGAPRRFHVNTSHVDCAASLPEGARVLGRTLLDPNGAVRFGERAWGVQFHPEFDGEIVRGYIDARRDIIANEGIDPASLRAEDAPESAELLRTFAKLATRAST
jgi:GMP synthase (glutamine-hydrolysing)